ncbi:MULTISPECIES: ATP-grasp domain-containing protein [unclassified Paenibacillus]|uniref:ATP-grasp domain-containing protein n=1 Tax=unclassified Paenibacillus TaxID=185978 RepID=UPI0036378238
MKKLLVLGASRLQIPILKKAKEMGIYTIAVDWDSLAPGKSEADEFHQISTNDVKKLHLFAKELMIDGIITNSDFPMRTVSVISRELRLNAISPISALLTTNKLLLREVLHESGITGPKFAKVSSISDVFFKSEELGFPFILKPVDSSASRGVYLIQNHQGIEYAYEKAIQYAKNKILIAEEYISGREFSVESITYENKTDIIAITEKITSGPPNFVETGHIIPANITLSECESINELIRSSINALGINNAITHAEVKVNPEGCFIIEIGPRLGGDYISTDLVPLATGYDLVENAVRMAMNYEMRSFPKLNRAACIGFMVAPPGILQKIEGLPSEASPELVRMELFVKEGQSINSLRSSLDRLGYILVEGSSNEEVKNKIENLSAGIKFHVTELNGG